MALLLPLLICNRIGWAEEAAGVQEEIPKERLKQAGIQGGPAGLAQRPDLGKIRRREDLAEVVFSGSLDEDLLNAASTGDATRVRKLLDKGAELNAPDALGMTPLMLAAQNGHDAIVNELLMRGADIHAKADLGYTALSCAALGGHSGTIQALILGGADVTDRGLAGMTPLMHAAQNGHAEACKALIAWAAEINAGNQSGMTPLMFAAKGGHADAVRLLLELGARPDLKEDIAGQTALDLARRQAHSEVAAILEKASP